MPRTRSSRSWTRTGARSWPLDRDQARRASRSSARRPRTSSPTSWPATPSRRSTRTGASGDHDGGDATAGGATRPARPATTATCTPTATWPRRRTRRARPRRRGVDGQQRQRAQRRQPLARLVGAALVGHPPGRQPGHADRRASAHRAAWSTATVDAFTGLKPGPYTEQDRQGALPQGHGPDQARETIRVAREIDQASGLLWQDGCVGPKVTRGFFDLNEVESNFPAWQRADRGWAARAAKGPGVRGGPEGTRTAYFYGIGFRPFGSPGARRSRRAKNCPLRPEAEPPPRDPATRCPPTTCLSRPAGAAARASPESRPSRPERPRG